MDVWSSGEQSPAALASWWFGPLQRPEPWLATLYVLTGLLLAPLWFAVTVVVLALTLAGVVTVIGIPVAVTLLRGLRSLSGFERWRASLVGDQIAARTPRPAKATDIRGQLGEPAQWLAVRHGLLALFAWPLLFLVGFAGWGLTGYLLSLPLWGWAVGLRWPALVAFFVAGVVAAGLAPRLATLAAQLGRRFVDWQLGPDERTELQDRVDSLTENRQAILEAVADERRRIERNLHDGVQQGLVAMGIDMSLAAKLVDEDPEGAKALIEQAQEKARASIGELRLLGRGLHPAILGDRGLDAALSSVVTGAPIPITLDYDVSSPLPTDIAEVAYFVVNEAVGNVLKHAEARVGSVAVTERVGIVTVSVSDDGRGGADAGAGTGLSGLQARVGAVDGRLDIDSPPGGPTMVIATLPIGANP